MGSDGQGPSDSFPGMVYSSERGLLLLLLGLPPSLSQGKHHGQGGSAQSDMSRAFSSSRIARPVVDLAMDGQCGRN